MVLNWCMVYADDIVFVISGRKPGMEVNERLEDHCLRQKNNDYI